MPPNCRRCRRSHKATQPQLLTCRELDGRNSAAKAFDRLVADIESDLGGSDRKRHRARLGRGLCQGRRHLAAFEHAADARPAQCHRLAQALLALRRGPAPRGARHNLFPLHQSCRLVATARRSSQEYCFGRERKDRSEPRALRFLLHNPKNSEPAAEKAKTHTKIRAGLFREIEVRADRPRTAALIRRP
jgi:hypothetical protein